MIKYLPLMFQHGMSRYWVPTTAPLPDFELPKLQGAKVRADYYRLITDLYVEDHLAVFQQWSAKYGMAYHHRGSFRDR
jgi:hypothetical protein